MITIADVQAWRAPEIKPIFEQNKFPPVSDVEESVKSFVSNDAQTVLLINLLLT